MGQLLQATNELGITFTPVPSPCQGLRPNALGITYVADTQNHPSVHGCSIAPLLGQHTMQHAPMQ